MPWSAITKIANDYGFPSVLILAAFLITKLYFRYKKQVDETRTFKKDEISLLSEALSSQASNSNKIFLYEQLFEMKYGKSI